MKNLPCLLFAAAALAAGATETENVDFRIVRAPGAVAVDAEFADWNLAGSIFCCPDVESFRSSYGVWIAAYRRQYVKLLDEAAARYFAGMTGGAEVPSLVYRSHAASEDLPSPLFGPCPSPDPSALAEKLCANRDREIAAGTTLWGVHKDDVFLSLNGMDARSFASQGQQRSMALSMKLGEAEISKAVGGEYPVILLDDVFSELDENRRRYILDSLTKDGEGERQIIITSCEPDVIPGNRSARVNFRHVKNGEVE